jgi:hypothetical protein
MRGRRSWLELDTTSGRNRVEPGPLPDGPCNPRRATRWCPLDAKTPAGRRVPQGTLEALRAAYVNVT